MATIPVSQALFSALLHTRTARKTCVQEKTGLTRRVGESLATIADLIKSVQGDIRSLTFELRGDAVPDPRGRATRAACLPLAAGPTSTS